MLYLSENYLILAWNAWTGGAVCEVAQGAAYVTTSCKVCRRPGDKEKKNTQGAILSSSARAQMLATLDVLARHCASQSFKLHMGSHMDGINSM